MIGDFDPEDPQRGDAGETIGVGAGAGRLASAAGDGEGRRPAGPEQVERRRLAAGEPVGIIELNVYWVLASSSNCSQQAIRTELVV